MDLYTLEQFRVVAELEHMTRAAEQLRVAQPALSRSIRLLEEELGQPLFDRTGRGLRLNVAGKAWLETVQQVFLTLRAGENELRALKGSGQTVTLAVRAASRWLPELAAAFQARYPDIRLNLLQHSGNGAELLIFSSDGQPLSPDEERILLLRERVLAALPLGHPLAGRAALQLRELAGERFIALQKGASFRALQDYCCQRAGFSPAVILESDDPATIRGMLGLGLGVALLPEITWRGVADQRSRLVALTDSCCQRELYLSHSGGWTDAARLLAAHIGEFFRRLEAGKEADMADIK